MKEEQQENLLTDIPSLVLPSFDNIEGNQREHSELLKEINNNQKAILENQEKLIKYFIPTEEQLVFAILVPQVQAPLEVSSLPLVAFSFQVLAF